MMRMDRRLDAAARRGTSATARAASVTRSVLRACALGIVAALTVCSAAQAYTAAGDRIFPATVLLPQIGPSDEFYITGSTLPQQTSSGVPGGRATNLVGVFDKTITDRLSATATLGYSWLRQGGGASPSGWQNFAFALQYLAILDQPREFLLSAGIERDFGGTGAARIGVNSQGATIPALFFGKGLGDFDVGYLRPFAVAGTVAYQISDGAPRPSLLQTGLVIEYSMPYLLSKVDAVALPGFLRATTPMIEMQFSQPVGRSFGATSTALIGAGFNYSGEGWDLGVEALIPTNRASGRGTGFTVQLHFSLDYLAPTSIGKPFF
jgi:hypothetical protein